MTTTEEGTEGETHRPQPPGQAKSKSPRDGGRCGKTENGSDPPSPQSVFRVGQQIRVLRNFHFASGRGVLSGTRARVTQVADDKIEVRVSAFVFDFEAHDLETLPETPEMEIGARVRIKRTIRFESGSGVMAGSLGTVQGHGTEHGTFEVRSDPISFDCDREDLTHQQHSTEPVDSLPIFSEKRGLPQTQKLSEGAAVLVARSNGGWSAGTIRSCDDQRRVYVVAFGDGKGGLVQKEVTFDHARWHIRTDPSAIHGQDQSAPRPRRSVVMWPGHAPRLVSLTGLPEKHAEAVGRLADWLERQPSNHSAAGSAARLIAEWAQSQATSPLPSPPTLSLECGTKTQPQLLNVEVKTLSNESMPDNVVKKHEISQGTKLDKSQWLTDYCCEKLAAVTGPEGVLAVENLMKYLAQGGGAALASSSIGRKLDIKPPQMQRGRVYSQIRDWARWQDHLSSSSPSAGGAGDAFASGLGQKGRRQGSRSPRASPSPGSPPPAFPGRERSDSPCRVGYSVRQRSSASKSDKSKSLPPASLPPASPPPVLQEPGETGARDSSDEEEMEHKASVIQRHWRKFRVRRNTLAGADAAIELALTQMGTVMEHMKKMEQLRIERKRLSAIGSPSDEDLAELDGVLHQYDGLKYEIAAVLEGVPKGAKMKPDDDVRSALGDLLVALCKEGDQRDGSGELVEIMLDRVDADFQEVLLRENLLVDACADGNVRFLRAMLASKQSEGSYDPAELVAAACFSQTARIPLVSAVLSGVDFTEVMDEVVPVLQEFFEDVATLSRLIPVEDKEGRHPLLRQLMTDERFTIDLTREDGAGDTVFSRCCKDGDMLFLDMLRAKAPEIIRPSGKLGNGTTPLILAIVGGHIEMVRVLARIPDTDLDQEVECGTALGVAEALKRDDIARILRKAGAKREVFNET
eukprot:Hpha_TRINITY_DN16953_c4_g2::TRINITY_DN16953_c4_g2_i2::g.52601::m.52601